MTLDFDASKIWKLVNENKTNYHSNLLLILRFHNDLFLFLTENDIWNFADTTTQFTAVRQQ